MIRTVVITITLFNKRLRILRKKQKISQKDFAKILGVSNVVLSRYENGERKPDYDILIKIAEYFDVSVDYLLGKSDIKNMEHKDDFETFINDPELETWYRELPESDEEELRQMKEIWEIIKKRES